MNHPKNALAEKCTCRKMHLQTNALAKMHLQRNALAEAEARTRRKKHPQTNSLADEGTCRKMNFPEDEPPGPDQCTGRRTHLQRNALAE